MGPHRLSPDNEQFQYTGKDWLLLLLDSYCEGLNQLRGTVVFSVWTFLERCGSASKAEALTCFGHSVGLPPIIIESNCAQIVSTMCNPSMDQSEIGFVATDARGLARLLSGRYPKRREIVIKM